MTDNQPWRQTVEAKALALILGVLACSFVVLLSVTLRYHNLSERNDRIQAQAIRAQQAAALHLYAAQIASCRRQNVARRAANDSANSLRAFLISAAATNRKRAEGQPADQRRINLHAADVFMQLAEHQHTVPIVNCETAILQP